MASIVVRAAARSARNARLDRFKPAATTINVRCVSALSAPTTPLRGAPQFLPHSQRLVQRAPSVSTPRPYSTQLSPEARVLNVCRAFDKIDGSKVEIDVHFMNDLGLDSLDHVELVMAVEDEFGFEIPDVDAEKLLTVKALVTYVEERLSNIGPMDDVLPGSEECGRGPA